MKYKSVLLTGGSGQLGQAIRSSGHFPPLLAPPRQILDITDQESLAKFFAGNNVDSVIHCAALARMAECERNPAGAIRVNIVGTSLLAMNVLKAESRIKKKIRFLYTSTDGVYPGTTGNYSERSEIIPYNNYGWTKLGGECAVRQLSKHCIIRTNFFDPEHIEFEDSATDTYTSKVTVGYLAKALSIMLESEFVGTINIGDEKKSDYERYKKFKPRMKPCTFRDIAGRIPFRMAKDSSLDLSLWNKIKKNAST